MTVPKPMDPFELEACERYIKGGEMLMGAPGDLERQLSDWCEALLGARVHHAAEVERLTILGTILDDVGTALGSDAEESPVDAARRLRGEVERLRSLAVSNALALTDRELRLILMGLRSRSDSHPLDLPGNAPEALALDARVAEALAGVRPMASEGAATPTPSKHVLEREGEARSRR